MAKAELCQLWFATLKMWVNLRRCSWQKCSWILSESSSWALWERCSIWKIRHSPEDPHQRPRWRRPPQPPWPSPWCCGTQVGRSATHCRTPACWKPGTWLGTQLHPQGIVQDQKGHHLVELVSFIPVWGTHALGIGYATLYLGKSEKYGVFFAEIQNTSTGKTRVAAWGFLSSGIFLNAETQLWLHTDWRAAQAEQQLWSPLATLTSHSDVVLTLLSHNMILWPSLEDHDFVSHTHDSRFLQSSFLL